jgi:hypothetical protein
MKNLDLGVEKTSLAVTALLFVVNIAIGETAVAVAIAVAGVLFLLDYVAIRFIVKALAEKRYSLAFSIFILVMKMLALLAIIAVLLIFAKLNIYGLMIGLTSVVIVIIGKGLKG